MFWVSVSGSQLVSYSSTGVLDGVPHPKVRIKHALVPCVHGVVRLQQAHGLELYATHLDSDAK